MCKVTSDFGNFTKFHYISAAASVGLLDIDVIVGSLVSLMEALHQQ